MKGRSFGWTLIQYNWGPSRKGIRTETHGGKSHEDTEKEALCKARRGLLKETNPVNA